MNLNPSDRKKLLALPFYLSKRVQLPEPRKGQLEYRLFEELYGRPWHYDAGVEFDEEHKITEFDYEKYFDPKLLNRNPDLVQSDKFKKFIRALNLSAKTELE